MRRTSILLVLFLLGQQLPAQFNNWTEDIAPIIYENCSSCHHDGGIGPFELMSYDHVVAMADLIHEAIEHGDMPPWPADPEYHHFASEAVLSQGEIDAIHNWIDWEMPYGDPEFEPEPPAFGPSGSLLENIDLTLEIEPYELQTNTDEYRWFVFENPHETDVYIAKIEVIPGLENVVHHADLFLDYTSTSQENDDADPLSGFNGDAGWPINSFYVNAWQPGGNLTVYPDDWGIRVPPYASFVVEIHYGPGGIGQTDNTKMNLQLLADVEQPREVYSSWVLNQGNNFIDGPLVIPAQQIVSFHHETAPLTEAMSVISICPHMHLLGKSFEVWYEYEGEEYPLIYIPHWDFHWQKYYTYPSIKVIPEGAVIKSEAFYDNTSDNHDNPFDPPQTTTAGLTTLDEMFLCYFIYADYEEGDELIVMDEELNISGLKENRPSNWSVFPNPASDHIQLAHPGKGFAPLSYTIVNSTGIEVKQAETLLDEAGGKRIELPALASGVYFLHWHFQDSKGVQRFFVE